MITPTDTPFHAGPAQEPMCTPQGMLFSREAILENLLAQKKANKRKLATWEAQQETLAREVCRTTCALHPRCNPDPPNQFRRGPWAGSCRGFHKHTNHTKHLRAAADRKL